MPALQSGIVSRILPADALEWLNRHGLDACELDDRSEVRAVLDSVLPSVRQRNAACLAVQAALERFEGHVDTAVTLYERALKLPMDGSLELRIRENFAHLLAARRQDDECEKVLAPALKNHPRDPRVFSMGILLRARRRDARALADVEALEGSMSSLSDLERARIYRRIGSAVYEASGDAAATERYLNLAIEHAEVAGAHAHAAVAYWGLFHIYSGHVGDVSRVVSFWNLFTDAATKAGDKGLLVESLTARYGFAAEIGDKTLLDDLQAQLRAVHGPERYTERPVVFFGDAMAYGLAGDFERMRQYLLSANVGRTIGSQRPLMQALLAIAHSGSGYEADALKSAYRALSLARPLAKEPFHETRLRLLARFLCGAVLLGGGRRTEAVRMLQAYESLMTPSLVCLRDAVLDQRYDSVRERAQDVYGFALLCEALERSAVSGGQGAAAGLTGREISILRAVSAGRSSKAIAQELSISHKTVQWHRNNILKKLAVGTTIEAVTKGRELQIIP